jgi:DNA sulfur modification protein DndC
MIQPDLFTEDPAAREIPALIEAGALFVANHSGGKDSQAMTIQLRRLVPAEQLVLIHADLPEVDWPGIEEHIRSTAPDLPLHIVRAGKTFFDMVEHRQMFPSPENRQCTSDLKRGPIHKRIIALSKSLARPLIVDCQGMRAEESTGRAKLVPWMEYAAKPGKKPPPLARAGRRAWRWLPIHNWSTADVFRIIREAGQEPHPAYAAGMSRLSCCFCIMANQSDLTTAAKLKPELYRRYVETERRIGQTMMMPAGGVRRFLPEITGVAADG